MHWGSGARVSATPASTVPDVGVAGTLTGKRLMPRALLPLAVVVGAPLLGLLCLRAPLINALAYRDPWFYSGYGWALEHHVEIFGWFYYTVRFPVVLPIAWSTAVLGPVLGYLALRCVLLVGVDWLMYACIRRFSSPAVAIASILLLNLNPFYLRLILWDYTSFIALPCSIAGAALWLMATRERAFAPLFVSGALLGAAVFANALSGVIVAPLLLVEALAAGRRGLPGIGWAAARVASAMLGVAVVFLLGYLGYRTALGSYSPRDLIDPTLHFLRSTDQAVAPLQRPPSEWLVQEARIWAPVLLCLATLLVLGREVFRDDLRARFAQFAVAYTATLWLYRFTATSAVIETWWAYSMTAATMAFALPVVLDALGRRTADRSLQRALVASAVIAVALTDLLVRNATSAALRLYQEMSYRGGVIVIVVMAGIVAAITMRFLRDARGRTLGVSAFFATFAVLSLAPARYIGINKTGEFGPDGKAELASYRAAYDMTRLLKQDDQPTARALIWSTMFGEANIVWTNLPHQGGGVQDAEHPLPLTTLGPVGTSAVSYPATKSIIALSEAAVDMQAAIRTLRRSGYIVRVERRGSWADGHLYYELLAVVGRGRG
jgi:hypothetical protein